MPPFAADAWEAYKDLAQRRPVGFSGMEPIPLADIVMWLDFHGITAYDDRAWILEVVTKTDLRYREWRQERERNKKDPGSKGQSGQRK